MAVIGGQVLTLVDIAKLFDEKGKYRKVIEMLGKNDPILEDMMWKEGNLLTGERTSIRTGLPTVYWRLINQGIPSSKSSSEVVTETAANLEGYSQVDKDLAELGGNAAAVRASESMAFMQSMRNAVGTCVFYGNQQASPEQFTGLSARYSSLSAANGANIVDGGGTGSDNTSIWIVTWGENTIHGLFPKGTFAGIKHTPKGVQTVQTSTAVGGGMMEAYVDHWQWKPGLVLKDWRSTVRIANIDVSNLVSNTSPADLRKLLAHGIHRVDNLKAGNPVIYMNRTVFQYLDDQRADAVELGGGITYKNVDGEALYSFRGIPIKVTDSLLETEARVI